MKILLPIAALLVMSCSGSRKHMSPKHGDSVRAAFTMQATAHLDTHEGETPAGLDPDEAQIVNENYRNGLSKKAQASKKAAPSGLLVIDEESEKAREK